MYRLLIAIAVIVLLVGGLSNLIRPDALESYIAARIDWRAAVAIPFARAVASIEILAAIVLLVFVRSPTAHLMAALVFLAYLLVHTFEFVKFQPATCPCAAGMVEALPPRAVHLLFGLGSAFMSVLFLSFVFRWSSFFGKEPLHVQA